MNKEACDNSFIKMNKIEILEYIQQQIDESIRIEENFGRTELSSYAYQKVYDFIEYYLED